jgi:hypothetical protein
MSRADKWMKMIKDPNKFFPLRAKNRRVGNVKQKFFISHPLQRVMFGFGLLKFLLLISKIAEECYFLKTYRWSVLRIRVEKMRMRIKEKTSVRIRMRIHVLTGLRRVK